MTNESNHQPSPEQAPDADRKEVERKIAARRRFLRIGAQGSAALVVTVTHQRAFGVKKNVMMSLCSSLQGVPDLKGVDKKKALEVSAMGRPKGMICRPRVDDRTEYDSCNASNTKTAKYFKNAYGSPSGSVQYVRSSEFKKGCGSLDGTKGKNTLSLANNYRQYEKGYCPIRFDANGLYYDKTAVYFKSNGEQKACKWD